MALKPTSARFIVPVDLYNRDLYVSLGESDNRFADGLLQYKPLEWVNHALKHMAIAMQPGVGRFGVNEGFCVLRLGVYPRTSLDYATLQHEIFHFVEYLCKDAGLPYHHKHSSEAWAYLIGFVTKSMYEKLW